MSKQTDNKQFWQRWASCYGPLMQSSEPLYAAIAQQMQPHLTPKMNVLELACGSGQLSFRLSRLVRDWEATDFSPKMIAQAKLKPRGAGLHFSVQDATSLPYADETFDAVLIANALHIMPRPEKALAEIYRGAQARRPAVCPNLCAWRGTPHPAAHACHAVRGAANL